MVWNFKNMSQSFKKSISGNKLLNCEIIYLKILSTFLDIYFNLVEKKYETFLAQWIWD
jgi:hypothetical protein